MRAFVWEIVFKGNMQALRHFVNSMLGLTMLLSGGTPGSFAQQRGPRSIAEQYLLAAANAERVRGGRAALRWDEPLHGAAAAHARWMAAEQSIAHQYSGEAELAQRAGEAHSRFSVITENVGEALTAPELHTAWMNSPHHRENLLDAQVDAVAISVVSRGGQLYAVEDFVRSVPQLSLDAQEQKVLAVLASLTRLQALPRSEEARRTCQLAQGYAGDRQPWLVMRYTTGDLDSLPQELRGKIASGRFRQLAVGACTPPAGTPFASYAIAVLLYP